MIGHWEADTVGGARHKGVIVTVTGRCFQFFADPYASSARLILIEGLGNNLGDSRERAEYRGSMVACVR